MVPLGAMLIVALGKQDVAIGHAVDTAVAGMVTLIPEGLILLVSVTYAAAALRMARARRALAAAERDRVARLRRHALHRQDRHADRAVAALVVARPGGRCRARTSSARRSAASRRRPSARTRRSRRSRRRCPAPPEPADEPIPFLSRRRWSGAAARRRALRARRPGALPARRARRRGRDASRTAGRRVVGVRHDRRRASPTTRTPACRRSAPLGLAVLAEELRPETRETVAFLVEQGVEIVVLSGDAAGDGRLDRRRRGHPAAGPPLDGDELPAGDAELDRARAARSRSSGGSRRRASAASSSRCAASGRYVAMVGDGVNDVPALKASRLSIAQGSGTQMAKAVADVVLVNGDFAAVPGMVAEGRRILRNIQRVDEALRHEVGVRGVPDRRDRDHAGRVPAAAAPPDDRRHAHRRHPGVLPRARAERRAAGARTASCARWAASPSPPASPRASA